MANVSKLSPWVWGSIVVMFATPGMMVLLLDGQYLAALTTVMSISYAVGLGRSSRWRRMGPAIPAAGGGRRD